MANNLRLRLANLRGNCVPQDLLDEVSVLDADAALRARLLDKRHVSVLLTDADFDRLLSWYDAAARGLQHDRLVAARDEARAALQNLLHAHQCRCSACLDAAAILHGAQEHDDG